MQKQQERKEQDDDSEDPEQRTDYIEQKVKDQVTQIEQGIERVPDLKGDKKELEHHFDVLFELHKHLREYMTVLQLPAFTQQKFQNQVEQLQKTLLAEKEKAIPKKRFQFKNKPKTEGKQAKEDKPAAKVQISSLIDPEKDLIIRKLRNETMVVDPAQYEGKQNVYIENIENCDIFLPFIMKALYIKNTYQSRVYTGMVTGGAHIETTNKSTYQIKAHQVRIHKANEVTFQLNVMNSPIIENCTKLKFGPYMFQYPTQVAEEDALGIEPTDNLWDQVRDFQWIKKTPSPNWSKMNEEEIQYLPNVHLPEIEEKPAKQEEEE